MTWERAIKLATISFAAGLASTALNRVFVSHPVIALGVHAGAQLAAFRYFGG